MNFVCLFKFFGALYFIWSLAAGLVVSAMYCR